MEHQEQAADAPGAPVEAPGKSAKGKAPAKPRAKRKTVIVAEEPEGPEAQPEAPPEAAEAPPELEPLPPSEPPAPEPLPPIPKPKKPRAVPKKNVAITPAPQPAGYPQLTPDMLYPILTDFLRAQQASSREAKRAMYRGWLNT